MRISAVLFILLLPSLARGSDCREQAGAGIRSAEQAFQAGDYRTAEQLFQSGIDCLARWNAPDHMPLLVARNNLAATLLHIGAFRQAERILAEILPLLERHGETHEEIFNALNNLGEAYFAMGQFRAASKIHEKALALAEALFDAESWFAATSTENLGRALHSLGQKTRSRALLNRALSIWEKAPRGRTSGLVTTLLTLAALDGDEKKYDAAEALHKRALAIVAGEYGVKDETYAAVLTHIAVYYGNSGQFERAERTCLQAIEALEAATGGSYDGRHAFLLEAHASILDRMKGRGSDAASQRRRAEMVRALRQ
jgi:tetratricopeptide (TPR) repeat protein